MNDIKLYLQRMEKSVSDKLFFLPYIAQTVFSDSGIRITDPTHVKLILKHK